MFPKNIFLCIENIKHENYRNRLYVYNIRELKWSEVKWSAV